MPTLKPFHTASENTQVLKALYKRLEAEETRENAAKGEEAAEIRTQQECILNGGVYLRHHLKKRASPKICLPRFFHAETISQRYEKCNLWRAGVLACKKQPENNLIFLRINGNFLS